MLGHRHATISLICMSTHKAMAARCLSYHQAAYGQPAIRALATAPLRRLALSVLFTIATNSYQTTCTVSERTFNKRQHANTRHRVDSSLITHYDNISTPINQLTVEQAHKEFNSMVDKISTHVSAIRLASLGQLESQHLMLSPPNWQVSLLV